MFIWTLTWDSHLNETVCYKRFDNALRITLQTHLPSFSFVCLQAANCISKAFVQDPKATKTNALKCVFLVHCSGIIGDPRNINGFFYRFQILLQLLSVHKSCSTLNMTFDCVEYILDIFPSQHLYSLFYSYLSTSETLPKELWFHGIQFVYNSKPCCSLELIETLLTQPSSQLLLTNYHKNYPRYKEYRVRFSDPI